ncbi:MAG: hypothetical protein ACYTGR_20040, partial [Planctomycetota bacterium]
MLDPAAFVATFAGDVLEALVHVSPEADRVTLFYATPLPASALVRVTVDGGQLADDFGNDVDADGDGFPGGIATIDFQTLTITALPGTSVCGRVFASDVATGDGGDPVNVPLEGVTVRVDGAEDELFAITDSKGDFCLDPAPVGKFFVHIDGATATNDDIPDGAYYPTVGKPFKSVAGQQVNVPDIFLPLVIDGTLQAVSEVEDTVVTFPDVVIENNPGLAGVELIVPAGSLFANDGTTGGQAGIAPVDPERLPGPLPPGLQLPLVITVQTAGAGAQDPMPTNFDVPAPVAFPNLPDPLTGEMLPPGAKSALWSFNHDSGRWEVAGPMTVSEDGTLVVSDPGVGVLAPGWHGTQPGNDASGGGDTPCNGGGGGGGGGAGDQCGGGEGFGGVAGGQCSPAGQLGAGLDAAGSAVGVISGAAGVGGGLFGLLGGTAAAGFAGFGLVANGISCFAGGSLLGCAGLAVGIASFTTPCTVACAVISAGIAAVDLASNVQDLKDQMDQARAGCGNIALVSDVDLAYQQAFAALDEYVDQYTLQKPVYEDVIIAVEDYVALFEQMDLEDDQLGLSPEQVDQVIDALTIIRDDYEYLASVPYLPLLEYEALIAVERALELVQAGVAAPASPQARVAIETGDQVLRIGVDALGCWRQLLPADAQVRVSMYDPATARYASQMVATGANGSSGRGPAVVIAAGTLGPCRRLWLGSSEVYPDSDLDGLPDVAEFVLGTDPENPDTDGDGVPDGAEVEQGTDPSDDAPVTTGIVATADTPGLASDVCAIDDLVVVADTSSGVSVFNVFNGMDPTIIAQVDTPGS